MNNQTVEDVIDILVGMIYYIKNKHKERTEQELYIENVQEQLDTIKDFADCVAFSYYPNEMIACAIIQAYQNNECFELDFVKDTIGRLPVLESSRLEEYEQIAETFHGKKANYKNMIEILEQLNPPISRKIQTMKELNILEDDIMNDIFQHNTSNDIVLSKVRKNKTILSLSDSEIENLSFYNFYLADKSMINAYISAETENIINQNIPSLQKAKNRVLVIPKTEEMILTNDLDNKSILKASLMKHLENDDFQHRIHSVWNGLNSQDIKDVLYHDDFNAYTHTQASRRGRK